MSGLPISHEPLNGNYSSCIMQRSNQYLPFCVVKELTWIILEGLILSIYLELILHKTARKAVISSFFCGWRMCLRLFLRSTKKAAMCFKIFSVLCTLNLVGIQMSFTSSPSPIWPQTTCAVFHFPSLITGSAVDLVLLVHVQQQMCWLCGFNDKQQCKL